MGSASGKKAVTDWPAVGIDAPTILLGPLQRLRGSLSLSVEVTRRVEQLAAIERRFLSNYLQGLVLYHLETIPRDVRQQVRDRLIASTSKMDDKEAEELESYLDDNDW